MQPAVTVTVMPSSSQKNWGFVTPKGCHGKSHSHFFAVQWSLVQLVRAFLLSSKEVEPTDTACTLSILRRQMISSPLSKIARNHLETDLLLLMLQTFSSNSWPTITSKRWLFKSSCKIWCTIWLGIIKKLQRTATLAFAIMSCALVVAVSPEDFLFKEQPNSWNLKTHKSTAFQVGLQWRNELKMVAKYKMSFNQWLNPLKQELDSKSTMFYRSTIHYY